MVSILVAALALILSLNVQLSYGLPSTDVVKGYIAYDEKKLKFLIAGTGIYTVPEGNSMSVLEYAAKLCSENNECVGLRCELGGDNHFCQLGVNRYNYPATDKDMFITKMMQSFETDYTSYLKESLFNVVKGYVTYDEMKLKYLIRGTGIYTVPEESSMSVLEYAAKLCSENNKCVGLRCKLGGDNHFCQLGVNRYNYPATDKGMFIENMMQSSETDYTSFLKDSQF